MAKSRSSKIPEALQLWIETVMAVNRLFRLLKQGMDPEKSRQVLKVLESANRRIEAITGVVPGQSEASVKFGGLKEVSAKQLRKLMEKTPVLKVKMEFTEGLGEEPRGEEKPKKEKEKPAAASDGAKPAARRRGRRAAKPAEASSEAPAASRRRRRSAAKTPGKAG